MSLPVWLPGPMFLLGVYVSGPMFFRGISVQWDVSVCGVSVWEGGREDPLDRNPLPYSEERAVCILLECILVCGAFCKGLFLESFYFSN